MRRDVHASHESPSYWTEVNLVLDKRTVLNGSEVQDVLQECRAFDDIECLRGRREKLG